LVEGATWSTPTRLSGERAPNLLVEYSVDGSTSWHSTFDVNTDLYMRTSNDNG